MGGILEEVFRRAHFNYLALVHKDDSIRNFPGKAHLVSHHYHGHPLQGQGLHNIQYLSNHLGVQS